MEALVAALVTAAAGIILAFGETIVSHLRAKKIRADVDGIKSAIAESGGVYYVVCPHCGGKVYLQGANIFKEAEEEQK